MTVLAIFGGVMGIGLAAVFSSIFNGYVLSVLWGWFMVPTFGVPELSIPAAIGIALVVSYLTHQMIDCEKEEKRTFGAEVTKSIIIAIVKPLFALFIGWIVNMFM